MKYRVPFAALLLSSTIVASGACAQSVSPAPARQSLDSNQVDLFSGQVHVRATPLSIGQQGSNALAYRMVNYGNGWTDNTTGYISVSGSTAYVSFGEATDNFTVSGSTYTSIKGDGASLSLSGNIYTYTTSNGTVVNFDKNNSSSVTTVRRPSGDLLTYAYAQGQFCGASKGNICTSHNTLYRLSTITNSFGYQLIFGYADDETDSDVVDSTARAQWLTRTTASVTNQASPNSVFASESFGTTGTTGSYVYQVTDAMGRVTKYAFPTNASVNGVAGISWPSSSSQSVTIGYDGGGRVQSIAVSGGPTTSYAYSDSGNVRTTTVTDGLGHATTYTFDIPTQTMTSMTNALGKTWRWQPDAYGRVIHATQPEGGYTQYAYDNYGNVTQQTVVSKTPGTPANIVISANYPCSSAATCNEPSWTKDANLNETDYTYDQTTGKLLTVTSPAATSGGVRPQTRYSYTSMQAYFQNGSGSIVASQQPIAMLTSISNCRTTASCTGGADETKQTISYGPQTAGTGNNLLLVSTSNGAGDGSLTATSGVTYDNIGNTLTTTDPLGRVTRYRYDADREVIGAVGPDPDGSGPLKNRAVRLTYTADGLVSKAEQGTVPSQSDADWANFGTLQYGTIVYDSADRKSTVAVWSSSGATYSATQYSYDGAGRLDCTAVRMNTGSFGSLPGVCSLSTQGSYGPDRISRNSYDAAGQLLSVTDGYGTSQARATVTNTYTPDGKVLTVADAKNNQTTNAYDGFDRLSTTTYPNAAGGDYDQYSYDANGNVTSHRMRDGNSVGFTYDALNRLTTRTSPHLTTGSDPSLTYAYDLMGHLASSTDENNHLVVLGYDALGRVTSSNSLLGGNKTIAYDLAGRRTKLAWPDGFYVTYGYDNADEMTAINENGTSTLVAFSYDDLGRRTSRSFANGTSTNYAYDPISRLTSLAVTGSYFPNTITLGNYSPASEIGSKTQSNDYFGFNQTVNANATFTTNSLNQFTAIAGVAQSYDKRGNLTASGSTSYTYNSRNQMVYATGGGTGYYHDALGNLDSIGAESLHLDYDGQNLITEINVGSNTVARRYVFGPGTDEPLVWYEGSGTSDRRFMDADERGSIVRVTDNLGAEKYINAYDEYGMPQSGNAGRFQYTAQKWIPSLGMYDYKARMYSPTLGRFMQTDPIGYGDGPNWYNYVHGNPVNGIDPSGLDDDGPPIIVHGVRDPQPIIIIDRGISYAPNNLTGGGGGGGGDAGDIVVTAKPKNKNTKTCAGSARGLAGNTRLYGKMGAFSTVEPNTAAIIPYQFGGSRKADLRPYVGSISGRLTGVVGGRTVTSTFNSITDVIDGGSPIPGVPVRDALQQLFPDQLIVEVTGGADVGSNASVVLNNYPASLPCPTGTTAQ